MPESPDRIQAAIDKLLAEAPPLSRGQEQLLTRILQSPPSNIVPPPADPDPDPPLVDPPPGSRYSRRMRATPGLCQLCQHDRPRVIEAAAGYGLAGYRPRFEEVMPCERGEPSLRRVTRAGLLLGLELPGPHAVLATADGW
jgi:hypothetical protein